ncbi:alpha/beta hydrolase-fold protein [Marinobacter salinexigens]|nr:alpha/beta hydrolase-fold protein [Marinobacter salinexigens]
MARVISVAAMMLVALCAYAGQPRVIIEKRFTVPSGEAFTVNLKLEKGEYIRGHLKSKAAIEAAFMNQEGLVRHVAGTGDKEAWIYFAAPAPGDYRLVVRAANPVDEVQLDLETVPLLTASAVRTPEMMSPFIQRAHEALINGKSADEVWNRLIASGTPVIESAEDLPDGQLEPMQRLVTFLWRGAKDRVLLFGGPGYEHDPLFRLANTDIWFRSYVMPDDTRMSYLLAPDVPQVDGSAREQRVAILATAQRDPENPDYWSPTGSSDIYSVRSVLELENAPSDHLLAGQGAVTEPFRFQLHSERLGNTRNVAIWVPEGVGVAGDGRVPLAIFFDGDDYLSKVPAPRILDHLIRAGDIPPVVAVFVSNPDRRARNSELPCNEDFADFMALELLPFVSDRTGFSFSGGTTLLAGASFGGLAAACTAFRYPDQFGLVLSQSGSFWWSPPEDERPEWLNERFVESPRLPLHFYLSAGRFETDFGESGILNANRQLEQILRVKGYPVRLEEFSAGHDYFHWRATLGRGLVYLLGTL